LKSVIPNAGNVVPLKRYAGKAGAVLKNVSPNAGNAGRYAYAGKAGAAVKSVIPNTGNAERQGYADKRGGADSFITIYNSCKGTAGKVKVDVFIRRAVKCWCHGGHR